MAQAAKRMMQMGKLMKDVRNTRAEIMEHFNTVKHAMTVHGAKTSTMLIKMLQQEINIMQRSDDGSQELAVACQKFKDAMRRDQSRTLRM